MLEIERKAYIFKIKEIWFADHPYDVKGYDSVFFKACKNRVNAEGFVTEEHATLVIDLTKSLDEIWRSMDKSSCRYAINRAIREGVKVYRNQNIEEFVKIYHSFRKRKGLSSFVSKFYDPELEIVKNEYGVLFVAEYDAQMLGGAYFLWDDENMRWLLGASRRLEVSNEMATLIGNANKLLIWEAIKYAKDRGMKEFDLGGYSLEADKNKSGPRYGINKFKMSFGGEFFMRYFYYKNYSKLINFIRKIYDKTPKIRG